MPDLEDFIDKVVGGQAGAAREQLQSMIGAKTADALDARKKEISSALFNNGEEQELEEPEVDGQDAVQPPQPNNADNVDTARGLKAEQILKVIENNQRARLNRR